VRECRDFSGWSNSVRTESAVQSPCPVPPDVIAVRRLSLTGRQGRTHDAQPLYTVTWVMSCGRPNRFQEPASSNKCR